MGLFLALMLVLAPLLGAVGSADHALGQPPSPSPEPANPPSDRAAAVSVAIDPKAFEPVHDDSGPENYYHPKTIGHDTVLAADYTPPLETVTVAYEVPENLRQSIKHVRWRWRVRTFPKDGDDCLIGSGDSAAGVMFVFKKSPASSLLSGHVTLLKYIWTDAEPRGTVCDVRRAHHVWRDTVVLESGGPTGKWRSESIDPIAEYVHHFGGTEADVPPLVAIALLTDGDQTESASAADYSGFAIEGPPTAEACQSTPPAPR